MPVMTIIRRWFPIVTSAFRCLCFIFHVFLLRKTRLICAPGPGTKDTFNYHVQSGKARWTVTSAFRCLCFIFHVCCFLLGAFVSYFMYAAFRCLCFIFHVCCFYTIVCEVGSIVCEVDQLLWINSTLL